MREAGYEWDAEKKELKKISQRMISAEAKEAMYSKPTAWSEEDSTYYDDICEILINLIHSETAKVNKDVVQRDLDWLISIKNRVIPQPKQEWSEEDKKRIQRISDFIWKNRKGDTDDIYQQEQDVKWLKSLKQRIGG